MSVRFFVCAALLLAAVAATPLAQQATDAEPNQLPVRRVVLYKSGVGYFEHQGAVNGSANVAIQFTSGQLNDVLKSLTALDLDNGQISSIGYNSVAPLDQRLGALRLPLGTQPDLLQFYNALRGARMEVQTGSGVVTGRLLGIERKPARNNTSEPTDVLTVISNEGTVRSITLLPTVSVRIAERDLRDDIGRYLAVVASGRDQDVRRMTLAATGNGTRRLVVSYISEVPIWKSTYRLVLPSNSGDESVLQGWAVVDNTVGADWTNVELSLVAGAPQSFIQQVSRPYYARRPEVALPAAVVLTPQTHQATLQAGNGTIRIAARDTSGAALPGVTATVNDLNGQSIATATTNGSGESDVNIAPGTYRVTMSLQGFTSQAREVTVGSGAAVRVNGVMSVGGRFETVTVVGETPTADTQNARQSVAGGGGRGGGFAAPAQGRLLAESTTVGAQINSGDIQTARQSALTAAAAAGELGDLFEYRLTQPVTIRTNQSALVPILNARVTAERVSIWSRAPGSGRPLRAVWLTNTSNLTLDGGTLSVIDANAFAGEGLIEALKPSEKRLVSYGIDLGVMVDARTDESSGRYTRVLARDGILTAEEETRQRWVYRIRNEDSTPRTIVVEHPVRQGWTLGTDPVPAEMTAGTARYKVQVAARGEATLQVTERRMGETRFAINDVDDRVLVAFAQRGVEVEEIRRMLRPLMEMRVEIAAFDRELQRLTGMATMIDNDQARMRENIKALGSSRQERQLVERYTRELALQEDRLKDLRTEMTTVAANRDAKQMEFGRVMREIQFDVAAK